MGAREGNAGAAEDGDATCGGGHDLHRMQEEVAMIAKLPLPARIGVRALKAKPRKTGL
jgi:hypothetical protein